MISLGHHRAITHQGSWYRIPKILWPLVLNFVVAPPCEIDVNAILVADDLWSYMMIRFIYGIF